jgi:hypothetical protein
MIENSRFVFADYSIPLPQNIIEIININGRIENLQISSVVETGDTLNGIVHLTGQLNSNSDSSLRLDGSFERSENMVDFDLTLALENVDLIRFLPYYSNTSFTILKEARVDLYSKANCMQNRLNATQKVHIYDIQLYDISPEAEDTLFGLPAKTVIEFFKDSKGEVEFSFNIVGTIDDPKFDPGPLIKQVLSNAIHNKIISKLQGLPREVIKISEKALKENLRAGKALDKLKIFDDEIQNKLKDIKEDLKKIIEYKP